MKTSRDRAIDAIYGVLNFGISRSLWVQMLSDKESQNSELVKKLVDSVEKQMDLDRAYVLNANKAS